jgi:hypothetical protein
MIDFELQPSLIVWSIARRQLRAQSARAAAPAVAS